LIGFAQALEEDAVNRLLIGLGISHTAKEAAIIITEQWSLAFIGTITICISREGIAVMYGAIIPTKVQS
jgi:hypothetical protein